jgi:hypothetical protein
MKNQLAPQCREHVVCLPKDGTCSPSPMRAGSRCARCHSEASTIQHPSPHWPEWGEARPAPGTQGYTRPWGPLGCRVREQGQHYYRVWLRCPRVTLLGSCATDSSNTTRSGTKPLGRGRGGHKFTGAARNSTAFIGDGWGSILDDDHATDKPTSPLATTPGSRTFFTDACPGWYGLHPSRQLRIMRYEKYVYGHTKYS